MYGDEEQCQKRLFDMRWPTGYRCPQCNHDKYCQLKSRQLYQCTYQPNADTAQIGNYKVESVVANSSRTASISFRQLTR